MTQEEIIDVLNEAQNEFHGTNEANTHSADILMNMFEKEKLEFAIEQLKEIHYNPKSNFFWLTSNGKKIKELEQKLKEYE